MRRTHDNSDAAILTRSASEGSEGVPSLALFGVALFVPRPEGASTYQPRASPWGGEPPITQVPAL